MLSSSTTTPAKTSHSKTGRSPSSTSELTMDHQQQADTNTDDVSTISARSYSTASRLVSNISKVFSDATMILMGDNPNGTIEEEPTNFDEDIPHEISGEWQRTQPVVELDDEAIDFLKDDPAEMTWSRRIAIYLMHRYAWYNPRLGKIEEVSEVPYEEDEIVVEGEKTDAKDGITRVPTAEEKSQASDQAYPFTHSCRENPSLEKAWAYFEHVSLARYKVPSGYDNKIKKNIFVRIFRRLFCKGDQQLARAEPGERGFRTRLYQPIFTPHKQLGDFGLGVGLYFSTLRAIIVIMLCAGLMNLPNFFYFYSSDYNAGEEQYNITDLMLLGSAICLDTSWVPCLDCNNTEYKGDFARDRVVEGQLLVSLSNTSAVGTTMPFVLRNNCNGANNEQAVISYATLFWVMLGTIGLSMYLQRMEVAFDEDEQTAQDYSIVIDNPPGDATDPKEWHNFFKQSFDGAHATTVTIAVDNDLLVRSLVERRELLRKIEMMVEPGTPLDTLSLAGIAAKEERERKFFGILKAKLVPGIPELFGRVVVLNARVQGLAQQDYPATKVFIAFETEEAQRHVLSSLNFGSMDVNGNKVTKVVDPKHLFRGSLLLGVSEPDEPNTIRWQDLNEKTKDRIRQQLLTLFATACAIFLIALIIYMLNSQSAAFAAIGIALFNSAFPIFAKLLTSLEAHASESGKQRSLYFKIAFFRWVNTAVVLTIITPFTSIVNSAGTPDGSLINKVRALFFAEIVTTTVIQLVDPVGHIQRHFLAPRATTQDAMNINMQGQPFELAERYTNMTKVLFLALWYSAIYPGALLLCALALFINYFTDRFSLMRTWKRAPHLGAEMSKFSRRYFFSMAIVAMAVISSYYWAAFPFDNVCPSEGDDAIAGEWLLNGNLTVAVLPGDLMHKRCLQDFFRFKAEDPSFPFVSKFQLPGQEWMTREQETITDIFGWTAVAVSILVFLIFMYTGFQSLISIFRGTYDPCGDDQGINFSDVPSINTYVPQIDSSVYSYPLLACNIDKIDKSLLEWTDPDRPDFVFYDLTKDAEVLLRGMDVGKKVVFSQIAHYPPKRK